MEEYVSSSTHLKESQDSIINSMGTISISFAELHSQLASMETSSLSLVHHLREDLLAFYESSFDKLRPLVDSAFAQVQPIVPQIPPQHSERLPFEIKKLNANYLRTKQTLLETLCDLEFGVRQHNNDVQIRFAQRTEEWKANRIVIVIEDAKKLLDPLRPLDIGSICEAFHAEQQKFTHCARKLMTDLALIVPPEQFTEQVLEGWWSEAENFLELHSSFISIFSGKFQAKFDEKNEFNAELLAAIEKELSELKTEPELSQTIGELTLLFKKSLKFTTAIHEKLQKYWNTRSDNLKKTFEHVRDFLRPLIEHYQKFVNESEKNAEIVESEVNDINSASAHILEELEQLLAQKSNEILLLVQEKDIC
jgi:hypothetical protein